MSSWAIAKIHDAVAAVLAALPLPPRARVLDAPCGAGELCRALAPLGLELHGADIEARLDPAAAALLGDRFALADLNRPLPWPDASFDALVCVEGIEHLENPFAFVREAFRLCRPGAYLLLTTPNIASIRSRLRFFGSSFFTQDPRPLDESAPHPLHHIGLRTFWEWRYILHTAGFRLVSATRTHGKAVNAAYAVFLPWIRIYTRLAFRREKNPAQAARNREIFHALVSPSLLFGDNLLLLAQRPMAAATR